MSETEQKAEALAREMGWKIVRGHGSLGKIEENMIAAALPFASALVRMGEAAKIGESYVGTRECLCRTLHGMTKMVQCRRCEVLDALSSALAAYSALEKGE